LSSSTPVSYGALEFIENKTLHDFRFEKKIPVWHIPGNAPYVNEISPPDCDTIVCDANPDFTTRKGAGRFQT
jgi:hypothetical protein